MAIPSRVIWRGMALWWQLRGGDDGGRCMGGVCGDERIDCDLPKSSWWSLLMSGLDMCRSQSFYMPSSPNTPRPSNWVFVVSTNWISLPSFRLQEAAKKLCEAVECGLVDYKACRLRWCFSDLMCTSSGDLAKMPNLTQEVWNRVWFCISRRLSGDILDISATCAEPHFAPQGLIHPLICFYYTKAQNSDALPPRACVP